jgi:hypothetical protein
LIIIDASLALETAVAAPSGRAVNDRLEAENHAIAAPSRISRSRNGRRSPSISLFRAAAARRA